MVCNGGTDVMNVDGQEETIQARLMKLSNVTNTEKIIDSQMLDVLIEAIMGIINDELGKEIQAYGGYHNLNTNSGAKRPF